MNLLNPPFDFKESDFDGGYILFKDFRKHQYKMLYTFLKTGIEYLSDQNQNYLELRDITISDKFTYNGVNNNELLEIEVYVYNKIHDVQKLFLKTYIPRLIDNTYFVLNGNYYIPTIYILDKPIVVKSSSVKLYGLFNSLTIHAKDDVCIFSRLNILLSYFLQLFYKETTDEYLYNNTATKFNLPKINHDHADIINYFNNLFNIQKTTRNQIIRHLENMFFDEYTKKLYQACYNYDSITLYDIIKYSLVMLLNEEKPSFVDLSNKRLVFMELLLSPFLKKMSNAAQQANNNYYIDEIKIDLLELVKHFTRTTSKSSKTNNDGLDGNYLYNIANLYNGVVANKCCFVNPRSSNPPSEIAATHPTQFKKICPITVADMDPGHTVSIVPDTVFDMYGNFI